AGLDAVNLSLDALNPARYEAIARRDALTEAWRGLMAARAVSSFTVKVNCVPIEENEDQWVSLAMLAKEEPAVDVRFIELMPIGLGGSLHPQEEGTVLARLEKTFGPALPCPQDTGGGPGRYVTFSGFAGRVGFISAISRQFCGSCNRVRLTASGVLKPCLQYESDLDLKTLLRGGSSDEHLSEVIEKAIYHKPLSHHFGAPGTLEDEGHGMNQIGG
ncbi:MAG: GTP 3',8-cyclase MoaA, partial [Lawsonibacter sp.]|nr:GTP 3',8-cyclase MoaA [Lawsonibacter sp.]